ncbi:MAG: hypothetical protein AB203_02750 [Parcubacteria bacterium C7867-008]|nr:MAG: hypothetical protein AB203_02750 [Parcubacteria bacterium C7867-008]
MNWIQSIFTALALFFGNLLGLYPEKPLQDLPPMHPIQAATTSTPVVPQSKPTVPANSFDPLTVKVGDVVGRFTVVSVEPVRAEQPYGESNSRVTFSANIPTKGLIVASDRGGYFYQPEDKTLYPRFKEEDRYIFMGTALNGSLTDNGLDDRTYVYGSEFPVEGVITKLEFIRYGEADSKVTIKALREIK